MIRNDEIITMLKNEFYEVMEGNPSFYSAYDFKIADEQQFMKERIQNYQKTIYIVVKFGVTTVNYHQSILPITITALSEQNGVNICKNLFLEFVDKFNGMVTDGFEIKQFFSTPSIAHNFEAVYDGYRSVISVSGSLLISEDANPFELYYLSSDGEYKQIPALSLSFANDIQLDTQVFYGNNNFPNSVGLTASLVIKGGGYLISNEIFDKMIRVATKRENINTDFRLKLKFKNSDLDFEDTFKLGGCSGASPYADLPTIDFTFVL